MFPSMNNLYYPSFYNNNNHSPSFTTSLETNNILLQNHLEFVSNYNNNYLRTSNNNNIHPILENPTNLFSLQAPIIDSPSSNNVINKKVSSKNRGIVKRNRHKKIWTAQGLRDRRVRLSINIAREFFNLQDMLGFDKASETVGWLLEKSKDAIHELTTTTSTAKPSLISTFDRENMIPRNYEMNDVFGVDKLAENSSKNAVSKKRRRVRPQHQLQTKIDGQSVALKTIRRARRARARDRARERTKNKNTTTLYNHHNNHTHLESLNQQYHQIIDQQSRVDDEQLNDQLIFHQSISGCSPPSSISTTLMPCGGINKGVSVRESIVIKSKSRDESSLNYNFNDMITTKDYDVGCYDYYHNDYNNFCGIIHTPGLSSALNIINLSKEIHINGKPWDDYRNQDLH